MNSSPAAFHPEIARRPSGWKRCFNFSAARRRRATTSATPSPQSPDTAFSATAENTARGKIRQGIAKLLPALSSLRLKLVGAVFIVVAPALAVVYFLGLEEWAGFLVGLLALGAAWFGGERFIVRQLRALLTATEKLAAGDLTSRAGLGNIGGEMGQLARNFDSLAESLQARDREREQAEQTLMTRALQQTVVAALGQFALVSRDFNALLDQAMVLVAQTLEVEFTNVLEDQSDGAALRFRAGLGWRNGCVGKSVIEAHGKSHASFVLSSGEPVVTKNLRSDPRFVPPTVFLEHGIVSGISVVISTRHRAYGVLGAYTGRQREFSGDEVHFLMAVATALGMAAERSQTEAELQKLAVFAQLNPNPAMELTADGAVTYFNDTALKLALSVNQEHPRAVLPPDVREIISTCLDTGESRQQLQTQVEGRTFSWSFHPVLASRVVHCYMEDITDRLNLEGQLRQSQKMESVGQLAAGVAHDFNNMLTIIQGHAGMIMARPGLPPAAADSIQSIYFASERAASLTRQLLMFSRKNVMQPKLLDLREVVANMSKMLNRVLGETIALVFNPPPRMPLVHADAGMVEQVIMNLCVNARDAMPKGGKLTVSISPADVSEDYVAVHPQARTGAFVCLRVTDTGCGMSPYIVSRIFEPFFTTKEVGKGTGLGLATVYGIVKQHDGWVEVASEIGTGSTFTVFFPASAETVRATDKGGTDPVAFVRGGKETILVVEDEPVLRDMAQLILQDCGYRIIVAANGKEALEIWERRQGNVDLLLTDMVMPEGVSGVDLAEKLLAQKPSLKIIFASGYTVDDISTEFLARNNHARFLQKPYTRSNLARIAREVFDSSGASGSLPADSKL